MSNVAMRRPTVEETKTMLLSLLARISHGDRLQSLPVPFVSECAEVLVRRGPVGGVGARRPGPL